MISQSSYIVAMQKAASRMPSRRMPNEEWSDFLARLASAIEARNRRRQAKRFPRLLKKAKFKVGRKVYFAAGWAGVRPTPCYVAEVALSLDKPPKVIYDLSLKKGYGPEFRGVIEQAIFPTRRMRKGI